MINIPKSTSESIIFPLNRLHGKYDETNWNTQIVENLCNDEDYYRFLDTIYIRTKNLFVLRIPFRIRLFYFLMVPIIFIHWGFCHNVFGNTKSLYSVLNYIIPLIISFLWFEYSLRKMIKSELLPTYKTILSIIEQFDETFESKSLKWIVPEHCEWLELRLNFKKLKNCKETQTPEDIPEYINSHSLAIDCQLKNPFRLKDRDLVNKAKSNREIDYKEHSLIIAEESSYYPSAKKILDNTHSKRSLIDVAMTNSLTINNDRNRSSTSIHRLKTKLRTKNIFKKIEPSTKIPFQEFMYFL